MEEAQYIPVLYDDLNPERLSDSLCQTGGNSDLVNAIMVDPSCLTNTQHDVKTTGKVHRENLQHKHSYSKCSLTPSSHGVAELDYIHASANSGKIILLDDQDCFTSNSFVVPVTQFGKAASDNAIDPIARLSNIDNSLSSQSDNTLVLQDPTPIKNRTETSDNSTSFVDSQVFNSYNSQNIQNSIDSNINSSATNIHNASEIKECENPNQGSTITIKPNNNSLKQKESFERNALQSKKKGNSHLLPLRPNRTQSVSYEMRWRCLLCYFECVQRSDLTCHYVLHKPEELAAALAILTKPFYKKIASKDETHCSKLVKNNNGINYSKPIETSSTNKNSNLESIETHVKSKPLLDLKQTKTVKKKSDSSVSLGSRDPHQCEICSKILSSRGNLAKHLIRHQEIKPWNCKSCSIGFSAKRDYHQHLQQKHSNNRPYVCKHCNKGFTQNRALKEHMIFHNAKKLFNCELCGKAFLTKKCVKRHLQRHSLEKQHRCHICYRRFSVRADLNSHMKQMHKMKLSNTQRLKSKSHEVEKTLVSDSRPKQVKLNSNPVTPIYINSSSENKEFVVDAESSAVLLPSLSENIDERNNVIAKEVVVCTTSNDLVTDMNKISQPQDTLNSSKMQLETFKSTVETASEAAYVIPVLNLDLSVDETQQLLSTSQPSDNANRVSFLYDRFNETRVTVSNSSCMYL